MAFVLMDESFFIYIKKHWESGENKYDHRYEIISF